MPIDSPRTLKSSKNGPLKSPKGPPARSAVGPPGSRKTPLRAHEAKAEARPPTLIRSQMARQISTLAMDDAATLLASELGQDVDPLVVPPLEAFNMDFQGGPKEGKSTLLAGDPNCVIVKFPDGLPLVRRCKASVVPVKDIRHARRVFDELAEYAAKHGAGGRWSCIGVDSIWVLWKWLAAEYVELYNQSEAAKARWRQRQAGKDGLSPDEDGDGVRHVSDIPGSGPYFKIASQIEDLLMRFNPLGWGWRTITHYQFKVKYEDGKPSGQEWRSDVPDTTAAVIAKNADVLVVVRKSYNADKHRSDYTAEFDTNDSGARIPFGLDGAVKLPNYGRIDDPRATGWDCVCAEYKRAAAEWRKDQAAFIQE